MNPERLREHLQALHEELRSVERLDARSSELLGEVREDIQRLLAGAGGAAGTAPAAAAARPVDAGRLERLAVQFEAVHPTLAESLRRLVDLLSKAGV